MDRTPVLKKSTRQSWHAGAPLDAGHQFLTAHGAALKGLRPITPREYVQRGLDLANWNGEDPTSFQKLAERLLVGGEWDAGAKILDRPAVSEADSYSGQFYRDILIRELSPILDKPPRLRPHATEPGARTPLDVPQAFSREQLHNMAERRAISDGYTRNRHGHVAAIGVAWEESGRTSFGWVMRPAGLHAAIDTVLWLLTAEDQPFADELRQCKWERCFNFFLSEKPKAGPRLTYCPYANCMEDAHKAATPERKLRKAARDAGLSVDQYRKKQAKKKPQSRNDK